jgi:hypothetical protein
MSEKWVVRFVMKRGKKWVNAEQEFNTKELADQSYQHFLVSDYFKGIEEPVLESGDKHE